MTKTSPTIHVVPVGTNLWTAGVNRLEPQDHTDVINTLQGRYGDPRLTEYLESVDAVVPDFLGPQLTAGAQALQVVRGLAEPELWPAAITSEIQTLSRVTRRRTSPYLPPGDGALLIASSPAVAVAALWTALVITGNDHSRISYLPRAAKDLSDLCGGVVITRIDDLNASNETRFRKAMGELGILGSGLQRLARRASFGQDFHFSLTGGYRATVPYMAGIAEVLMASDDVGQVSASILHESTGSGLIPYPLRPLSHRIIRDEVTPLAYEGLQRNAGDRFLDNYAYVTDDDGVDRLTPFGESLVKMVQPTAVQ